MKRLLILLLAMAMLLSMAACGPDDDAEREDNPSPNNNFTSSVSPTEPETTAVDLGQYCQEGVDGWYKTDTLENDEWSYWIRHSKTGKTDHAIIIQYLGTDTSIVIPDSIDGYPVTQFRTYGGGGLAKNLDKTDITSIEFPDTLYFITAGLLDDTAWYKNQPDGPVFAGNVLYKYKGTLPEGTSYTVDDGTVGIAGRAFDRQKGLKELTVPDTVVCIGNKAFANCPSLEKINLSKELRDLGGWVFEESNLLKELYISEKLYYFDRNAFDGSEIWNVYYAGDQTAWNKLCDRSHFSDSLNLHYNQVLPN